MGLIRVRRKVIGSTDLRGKYCCAMYATTDSKRERHSHYLTKARAEELAKSFRTPSAKKFGFKNVKVRCFCK